MEYLQLCHLKNLQELIKILTAFGHDENVICLSAGALRCTQHIVLSFGVGGPSHLRL